MTSNIPIIYRMLDITDQSFVFHSFLKSFRDSPMVRGVPNTLYYKKQHDLIEALLIAPTMRSVVACNPDEPTQIYGYIMGQAVPDQVEDTGRNAIAFHWVYVKQPFRNLGIAKALYKNFMDLVDDPSALAAIYYSHRVKTTERLLQSLPALIFNPYLV